MVSTMLSRAVLVVAALSAALAADVPESHIMHVARHGMAQLPAGLPQLPATVSMIPMTAEDAAAVAAQTPADERSLKVLPKAGLLSKFVLKPKFPFGLKDKLPLSLKKKLPLFLGGTAAAAGAGAAGAGAAGAAGAAGSLGALGIHGLDFGKLGGDAALLHQYPVWKVHRYNGIDLRPVRLGAPAPGGPYPAAAPAPYAFEEPKQVYGPPPKEVAVPEPVYGPPAETYGPPAETYGPPAETYGPPAETYGPPAQTYGPPAETYGPPAQTYGPPAETYGPPTASANSAAAAPAAGDTNEGLEALSQLGALTDFLPGGGGSSGALASLGNLGTLLATSGRSKGEILSTLSKLKEGFPDLIKSAVLPAPAPAAESAVYHPPAPTGIHGLLQKHPLISHFTNGFRGGAGSHVALPPLPELPTLPEIKGLKEIPGIPALPHIKLPTKYIAQGGPYVSVRYPTQHQQSAISPRGQLPIPASAPAFAPAQTFAPAPAPVQTFAAPAQTFAAPAPAPAQTFAVAAAPAGQQTFAASAVAPAAPAASFASVSTSYSIPAAPAAPAPASVPALEIPAAPSVTMQPPVHPAQTYAQPSQAGPEQAIQQVAPAVNPSFTLPLEQPQQQQQQQYAYQAVNSYGTPVSQETYQYVSNQQYAAPAVTQYAAPVTQYSAPVTQYAAPDAFVSASEPQGATADAEGREQQQQAEQTEEDDERADINPNSRSDHIDAALDGTLDAETGASEASEVRVLMPSGETHAVSSSQAQPAVSPVFNREEQARRLEKLQEMRQMVDQMVDLTAYLDPAHPASSATVRAAGSAAQVDATAAPTAAVQQSEQQRA